LAQTVVPPALSVQRTAPQLVAFAGSQSNFQNLVNGLAQGTPVQLVSVLPDGSTQVVTFTPGAALPPDQIAQALEGSRQQLIGLGIGSPTAEQIARSLTGGVVPTALGGSQVTGALNPPSPAAQIQSNAAAGSTTAATATAAPATSAVIVQVVPPAAAVGTSASPPFNTSDSPIPSGATSRSPTVGASAPPATPAAARATTPPANASPRR
jgi:hypothetical protein